MSVILLSDRSALGTSDEHRAFDLSVGRRITPVEFQAIPQKPAPEQPPTPTRPREVRTEPSASGSAVPEKSPDSTAEIPSSGYLPGSG